MGPSAESSNSAGASAMAEPNSSTVEMGEAQQEQPPIIDIKKLQFEYFGKKILYDIDFQVNPGERVI